MPSQPTSSMKALPFKLALAKRSVMARDALMKKIC